MTDPAEAVRSLIQKIRHSGHYVEFAHGRLGTDHAPRAVLSYPPNSIRIALRDLIAAGKRVRFQLDGQDKEAIRVALEFQKKAMDRAEMVLENVIVEASSMMGP